MMIDNKLNPFCVKVPKIFDWVNKSTFVKLKEKVKLEPDMLRSFTDIRHIKCFLSDCRGKPVSLDDHCNIICQILTPVEERTTFEFLTPKGKPVKLQRIYLLKQGFVTVEFFNEKQMCLQCVFPFSEVETVFICAPIGTEIECEITSVECKAFAIPPIDKCCNSIEMAITILLCQSIISVADAKLEILARNCKPRKEFTANLCPSIKVPISCPIFPQKTPSS